MNRKIYLKIRIVIVIALLLFLIQNSCYGQLFLTFQQALDSAKSRNLQIKQAELNAQISEEDLKQSKYNLLPNFTASSQSSVNWGRSLDLSTYNYTTNRIYLLSGNLGTQFILFQGGALRKQIVQNKLILDADQTMISKIEYDITIATATTFLQILAGEDLLLAAKQQLLIAKLNAERISKGLRIGKNSTVDLAQAQARVASCEFDAATIQGQLTASLNSLRQLIDLPSQDLKLIRPALIDVDTQNQLDSTRLLENALAYNPDIQISKIEEARARQNIQLAKSSLYPSLSIFGSVGSNFSDARSLILGSRQNGFDTIGLVKGSNQPVITPRFQTITGKYPLNRQLSDNFYQSAGLSLQIPLFNRFITQTNIRKAKIAAQLSEVNTRLSINNFTKIFNQAYSELQTSAKRMLAAKTNFAESKEVLRVNEKRFEAGLLNSLEINIAVSNANKAEFELIQARYDLIFRYKLLQFYCGKKLLM